MKPMKAIGLDFETFSRIDLPKHGLWRYVNDESFRPLVAATYGPLDHLQSVFDFVEDYEGERDRLLETLADWPIVAHNAGFEQAVLQRMGIEAPSSRFIDSAALARFHGAAGKLEAAAPQLLNTDKVAAGWDLIKLFSIPHEAETKFDTDMPQLHPDEWQQFKDYCSVDAELSWRLFKHLIDETPRHELEYNTITMDMNNTGWPVDVLLVEEMYRRYMQNVAAAESEFRAEFNEFNLNLNSHPQLVKWCAERGVRATSFNEQAVSKMLDLLDKKLQTTALSDPKHEGYRQVARLLSTKQVLGGSSLKKLQTIMNQVGYDDRLRDNYLHCGAGATARTTGRGVQMQNLKRLHGEGDDMTELMIPDTEWDNEKLAANLRQVFAAEHEDGRLIVGDFSSVESRGLAWQADEQWKLSAYEHGQDLYKVQAGHIFDISYEQVTKEQRQIGKVGELSCGYGAGAEAVRDFAEKMGVVLSDQEAAKLVKDWRAANPGIVQYWYDLHDALVLAAGGMSSSVFRGRQRVVFEPFPAPESLQQQTGNPDLLSLRLRMIQSNGLELLSRVIHGVELQGRNVVYWKPSERKTGDLWTDRFTDPKTKRTRVYNVYGGKLSGLLTQSLCRELFFKTLGKVTRLTDMWDNVKIIGQFHDEIVVEWTPDRTGWSLGATMAAIHEAMSSSTLPGFPLDAEVKAAYRYIK